MNKVCLFGNILDVPYNELDGSIRVAVQTPDRRTHSIVIKATAQFAKEIMEQLFSNVEPTQCSVSIDGYLEDGEVVVGNNSTIVVLRGCLAGFLPELQVPH